jgi:hypothetical protein
VANTLQERPKLLNVQPARFVVAWHDQTKPLICQAMAFRSE